MIRRTLLGGGLAAAATGNARPPAGTPVAGRYDVVVWGGGTSGLPAALAAARRGAKVAIVERYGFLGGNPATSIMPAWHGLREHHTGMLTEFARRVKDFGLGPDPLATQSLIEPEAVKILFLKMALEAKVDLHLHTFICGVEKSGAGVARIVTESKSGRRAFEARTFIDATGDGDAGCLAGAKCLKGDNGKMQGMALRFRIGYVDNARYLAWAAQNLRYCSRCARKRSPGSRSTWARTSPRSGTAIPTRNCRATPTSSPAASVPTNCRLTPPASTISTARAPRT